MIRGPGLLRRTLSRERSQLYCQTGASAHYLPRFPFGEHQSNLYHSKRVSTSTIMLGAVDSRYPTALRMPLAFRKISPRDLVPQKRWPQKRWPLKTPHGRRLLSAIRTARIRKRLAKPLCRCPAPALKDPKPALHHRNRDGRRWPRMKPNQDFLPDAPPRG
jgi:hypothetical protein